jgi:hypothetical protein
MLCKIKRIFNSKELNILKITLEDIIIQHGVMNHQKNNLKSFMRQKDLY